MKKVLKKPWLIVVSVLVLAVIVFLVCWLLRPKQEPIPANGEYYPAKYDENIFLNQAYMSFQRDLRYSTGSVEQLFSYERDYESAEVECQFFLDYFHTVINGNYEDYPDFFVDGYFEEVPRFTMQMIYDPFVKTHSVSNDEINGEEVKLYNFLVSYRIFKNNKTYRSDVDSNVAVPQVYQLIKTQEGNYRIFRILNVEVENGD